MRPTPRPHFMGYEGCSADSLVAPLSPATSLLRREGATSDFYARLSSLAEAHEADLFALRRQFLDGSWHSKTQSFESTWRGHNGCSAAFGQSACCRNADSGPGMRDGTLADRPIPRQISPCSLLSHISSQNVLLAEADTGAAPRKTISVPSLEEESSMPLKSPSGREEEDAAESSKANVEQLQEDYIGHVAASGGFDVHAAWKGSLSLITERKLSHSRSRSMAQALRHTWREDKLVERADRIRRFVLHPNSMRRLIWDIFSMMLLAYDVVVIPFMSAFDPEPSLFIMGMGALTMLFWTFDMLMSMVTGYQRGRSIEMRLRYVIGHYLRTWFIMDLVIVGMDWSLFVVDEGSPGGGSAENTARLGRSLRTLRFIRTLRLIRALKLKRLIQVIQDLITTEFVSICWGIMKVVLCLVVANHIVACCWYAIGNSSVDERSWIEESELEGRSLSYRYATALHWSLTQFTPASMEVFPQNSSERIFAVCILLMAMITFSSFVSMLTTSMAELRKISSNESRQFWLLRRYLRDWCVPKRVALRIERYLEYAYQRQKLRVQERDIYLLRLLSEPLREELRHETLKVHVSCHPLFSTCLNTTRIFSRALSEMSLARGDIVFSCAEQAKRMSFLSSGMLDYTLGELEGTRSDEESNNDESRKYSEYILIGQYVCEAVLWCPWLHLGDLQALTECSMVNVDAEAFGQAIRINKPLWIGVKRYAQRFITELNRLPREDLTDMLNTRFSSASLVVESDFMETFSQTFDVDELESFWARFLKRAVHWCRRVCGGADTRLASYVADDVFSDTNSCPPTPRTARPWRPPTPTTADKWRRSSVVSP